MKEWFSEINRLIRVYISTIRDAWASRNKNSMPQRLRDEYDFLPSHLELIEKPVSPVPRIISLVIILCLIISLLTAIFFHVEIVAVSSGKLELTSRSKKIQPLETSLVKHVYVKDGDFVKEGELLISLSATGAESDKAKIESALLKEKLSESRQNMLLRAIEENKLPEFPDYQEGSDYDQLRSEQLLREQFSSWKASRDQQLSVIRQRMAEKETINSNIKKLVIQEGIALEKFNDVSRLYKKMRYQSMNIFSIKIFILT